MDIKGMLNEEDRKGDKHPRRQAPPPSKPPSLPSLNTSQDRSILLNDPNASPASAYGHTASFSAQPSTAQSPTYAQQLRAEPYTPGFPGSNRPPSSAQHHYPGSAGTTPTPLSANASAGPYQQPLHPPPRPSLSRSPSSSSFSHGGNLTHKSPVSGHPYAHQSPVVQTVYPPQQNQLVHSHSPPTTPLTHPQSGAWTRERPYGESPLRQDVQTPSAQSIRQSPAHSSRRGSTSQPSNTPPLPRQVSAGHSVLGERDKSESVSPKTVVAPLPSQNRTQSNLHTATTVPTPTRASPGRVYDSARDLQSPIQMQDPKSASSDYFGNATQHLNQTPKPQEQRPAPPAKIEAPSRHATNNLNSAPDLLTTTSPDTAMTTPSAESNDARPSSSLSQPTKSQASASPVTTKKVDDQDVKSTNLKRPLEADSTPDSTISQPASKKIRFKEPPIWARRAKNTTPLPKYRGQSQNRSLNGQGRPPVVKQDSPVQAQNSVGTWEPTFTNVIPHEELTRGIANFLFDHVVTNNVFQEEQAGKLEIEAKLGRIIDKRTNERVKLPIQTEAIISDGLDVAFQSFMTEHHHRRFNEYLNQEVAKTQVKPRIKMQYVHTRETDTFYELPQDEMLSLPTPVQAIVKPGHKLRLRVTKDQKTGSIMAKIVKARVKDLHIYSPKTEFDWRISVSFEVNWTGDFDRFSLASEGEGYKNHPDRNKDRVSYRHLHNQIDLTQVKPNAGPARGSDEATHELEVELDSGEVKKQGKLAQEGKDNQYEDLVKGFADNVRILVRLAGGAH